LTCEALVKPTCEEAHHQTHSLLEEAEESQTELDQVLNGFKAGDAPRGRVNGVLHAKLKAIEAQIAEKLRRSNMRLSCVKKWPNSHLE